MTPSALQCLHVCYDRQRSLFSYDPLVEVPGLTVKSAVKKVLERLAAQGHLECSRHGGWTPASAFLHRPMAPTPVPAGFPMDADVPPVWWCSAITPASTLRSSSCAIPTNPITQTCDEVPL